MTDPALTAVLQRDRAMVVIAIVVITVFGVGPYHLARGADGHVGGDNGSLIAYSRQDPQHGLRAPFLPRGRPWLAAADAPPFRRLTAVPSPEGHLARRWEELAAGFGAKN